MGRVCKGSKYRKNHYRTEFSVLLFSPIVYFSFIIEGKFALIIEIILKCGGRKYFEEILSVFWGFSSCFEYIYVSFGCTKGCVRWTTTII